MAWFALLLSLRARFFGLLLSLRTRFFGLLLFGFGSLVLCGGLFSRFATLFLFTVEARQVVLVAENVAEIAAGLAFFLALVCGKAQWLLARFVKLYYLENPLCRYRNEVYSHILVGRISNQAVEDVALEVEIRSIGSLEPYITRRHTARGFDVGIDLEVETTFQFGALSGELLRVERNILIASGAGGYRHKIGHPLRAAQWPSARADTAYATGLLAGTDLLHLDTHLEGFGQNLDKLAEVYTFVGDIVENSLIAVALVLYVANLHIEAEAFGYLAGAYHGIVLSGLCLLEFLDVGRLGEAEYPLGLGCIAPCRALHSQLGKSSG